MYVVTFYSFKGGVGRSMALVNVAAELVKRGRSVLVVDMDLEAPGLPSFGLADAASLGMVDFLHEYIRSGRAPDARSYISQCNLPGLDSESGRLALMSAGRQDEAYARRLASIDWQELYAHNDGFLLFEDLKNQWRSVLGFDYVLVDSRTGHTDSGGVCTRQLPNAVVCMFFPNGQNIDGMAQVVSEVRSDRTMPDRVLHFVPSKVPDLDDEDGILQEQLLNARRSLGYEEPAPVINYYPSMNLVRQEIFTLQRPKTRLAVEYRRLTDVIVAENLEDRDGAIGRIVGIDAAAEGALSEVDESLISNITERHKGDAEILERVAILRAKTGSFEAALALTNAGLKIAPDRPRYLARRARLKRIVGEHESAVADALTVFKASGATFKDVWDSAVTLMQLKQREPLAAVGQSPVLSSLTDEEMDRLAATCSVTTEIQGVFLPWLRRISDPHHDSTTLVLSLIGQRQFKEAMTVIAGGASEPAAGAGIGQVFNFAMADWGLRGTPSPTLFARVLSLSTKETRGGPNFFQCIAIAHQVCGNVEEAKSQAAAATSLLPLGNAFNFSAWRYLLADHSEFAEDVREALEGRTPICLR